MEASTREEIDKLLRQMSVLESNLGKDSTKEERIVCKAEQWKIGQKIKALDEEFFKIIYPNG
jgi:hypothetical protein